MLKSGKVRALVRADEEDARIDIWIGTAKTASEDEQRIFLDAIRGAFGRIHEPFEENLEVEELAPVAEGEFEKLSKLMEMHRAGEETIWVEGSGKQEIESLLEPLLSLPARLIRGDAFQSKDEPEPSVFVSYRHAESSNKVDLLCNAAEKRTLRIQRDREDIRVGGSIGDFMRRLSRGERIVVFLGPEYLENYSCVWELYHIWKASGGRGEEFRNRIVAFVHPDLEIGRPAAREKYRRIWVKELKELAEIRKANVADGIAVGEEDEWQWIKEFVDHMPKMLKFLNDRLFPRDFEELVKDDFAPLWELLEV